MENKDTVKASILEELALIDGLAGSVLKYLLKKTHKIIFSVDYDQKKVSFRFEKVTGKIITEKKMKISEKYYEMTRGQAHVGTAIYEFDRSEIESVIVKL